MLEPIVRCAAAGLSLMLPIPPFEPCCGADGLQAQLPAAIEGGQPLPEGLMWLLLTGDVRDPPHPITSKPVPNSCHSMSLLRR